MWSMLSLREFINDTSIKRDRHLLINTKIYLLVKFRGGVFVAVKICESFQGQFVSGVGGLALSSAPSSSVAFAKSVKNNTHIHI